MNFAGAAEGSNPDGYPFNCAIVQHFAMAAKPMTRVGVQSQSDSAKIIRLKCAYWSVYPQVAAAFRRWTHRELLSLLSQRGIGVPRIAARRRDAALCLICVAWPGARAWQIGADDQRNVYVAAELRLPDAPPGPGQAVNGNQG
jgi:hypothetical protein